MAEPSEGTSRQALADRPGGLLATKLFVPRERLPEPEDDEFYHADLIGLRVDDEEGNAIGAVIAMHNFGAGDIIDIQPTQGGAMMLPFNATTVPEVDIKGGRVVVALPDVTEAPDKE